MKTSVLRQWDEGIVFATILLSIGVLGVFCLTLLTVQGAFSFSLILPIIAVIACLYFSFRFFSLWNTMFLVSDDGIRMIRHKREVSSFSWQQINKIYVRSTSIPAKNHIYFASKEILQPFALKHLQKVDGFLFWMSYSAEKEDILSKLAESIIVRA